MARKNRQMQFIGANFHSGIGGNEDAGKMNVQFSRPLGLSSVQTFWDISYTSTVYHIPTVYDIPGILYLGRIQW